ncbi:MAG TPA: hypothetical protein VFJ43_08715 [Bacteroidia bacterium]|nr:hypothetical protein [Bacteroidia bacterium]
MKAIITYFIFLALFITAGIVLIKAWPNNINISTDIKSFLIGAISSAIVVLLVELIKVCKLYNALASLQGEWFEYCPYDKDETKYVFTGLAVIKYNRNNLLNITLKTLSEAQKFVPGKSYNVGSSWQGTIHMNEKQPSVGRISYSYSSKFPYVTEFGYKEITIEKSEKLPGDFFILMTEHSLTGETKFKTSILKRKFEQTL